MDEITSADGKAKTTFSKIADEGFKNAASYDTHRPTYPPTAVTNLLNHLNLVSLPNARILEIGAGTGKFTELLANRAENYEILAIEPHREMREVLERKKLKGVVVRAGESTGLGEAGVEKGWADGVVVAQAFHWFANGESLKEFHRALKPGGSLGLIWNIENYNSPVSWPAMTTWEESLRSLTWSFSDDQARFRNLRWKEVFESPSASNGILTTPLQTLKATFTTGEEADGTPLFSLPLGEENVEWTVCLSVEKLWERYCTLSQIAIAIGKGDDSVRKRFDEAIKEASRNENGELDIHGVTVLYWTSRV